MLPNGGFPPIVICDQPKVKETKEEKKGFFYSADVNNLNIRRILKKSNNKMIKPIEEIDDLEVVESL